MARARPRSVARRVSQHTLSAELADHGGVHPVYLAQAFRARFGCTVGEYVRRLRVDYAAVQLRGDTTVSRVAFDSGFADHSHLTRVFRRMVGVTPTEYRDLIN